MDSSNSLIILLKFNFSFLDARLKYYFHSIPFIQRHGNFVLSSEQVYISIKSRRIWVVHSIKWKAYWRMSYRSFMFGLRMLCLYVDRYANSINTYEDHKYIFNYLTKCHLIHKKIFPRKTK